MDVVTLALAKKGAKAYTDKVIDDIGRGISYRGAVNYYNDLPQDATLGDCYSVLYEGTSGTTPSGAEYIWGKVNDSDTAEWIKLGEEIDLTDYIKDTDYASDNKSGVIKTNENNGLVLNSSGQLYTKYYSYSVYSGKSDNCAISKRTLENVITGKDLTTKTYVDNLVGDISEALDLLNGEVI